MPRTSRPSSPLSVTRLARNSLLRDPRRCNLEAPEVVPPLLEVSYNYKISVSNLTPFSFLIGAAAAAGGPAAEAEKPKEEEPEEEVDMGGLFGGGDDDY
jgi:hypothetical protein